MAAGVLYAYFDNIQETSATFYAEFEATASSTRTRRIKLEIGTRYGSYTFRTTTYNMTSSDGIYCDINNGRGAAVNSLNPGTTYYFRATLGYRNASGVDVWQDNIVEDYFTTEEKKIVIDPWSWSASNGSATASQTSTAYRFVRGQIGTDTSGYFSYRVWNDMVDKANELAVGLRGYWDTTYASLSGTKVSSGEALSATKFNSLRNNINLVQASGVPVAREGQPIYGEYFTKLTDAMNQRINSL